MDKLVPSEADELAVGGDEPSLRRLLDRFANATLCDPVSRVGRDPMATTTLSACRRVTPPGGLGWQTWTVCGALFGASGQAAEGLDLPQSLQS